ncbi:MAG: hypothetical protein LBE84_12625, partial [Planctomycetota bacterium]|nr:hypothetical protein [Planctomycetota bacterium]
SLNQRLRLYGTLGVSAGAICRLKRMPNAGLKGRWLCIAAIGASPAIQGRTGPGPAGAWPRQGVAA